MNKITIIEVEKGKIRVKSRKIKPNAAIFDTCCAFVGLSYDYGLSKEQTLEIFNKACKMEEE